MNLGQMLFNGKCKVFAPFYYIPMEIGIKYFLQGNFSIKIINIILNPQAISMAISIAVKSLNTMHHDSMSVNFVRFVHTFPLPHNAT